MPTTDRCDGQSHGGATQSRTTRWEDETTMNPHLRRLPRMDPGSDSITGEGNVAAHRAMEGALPLRNEQSFTLSRMCLHDLKTKRERQRIIARDLCSEAKETLELTAITSDVYDQLKSFLCQLRKTDAALRFLNEKIEPFIDIDHLDEEFAANVDYEDQMTHIMCRLYFRLKGKKSDDIEKCQIIETLNSSENFREFYTLTDQCHDLCDLETPEEPAPPSDFLLQAERENSTPTLAELDLQTEAALLSCAFQEFAETTASKIGLSTSPIASEQSPYSDCLGQLIMDFSPAKSKGPGDTQTFEENSDAGKDTEERYTDVFSRRRKKIAVARTRPHILTKKVRCWSRLKNRTLQEHSKDSRINRITRSRRKQKPLRRCFQTATYKPEEPTSEFKSVEDRVRILAWLRRLHRHTRRVLKSQPLWKFRLLTASPDQTRNGLNVPTGRGLSRASLWPGKM